MLWFVPNLAKQAAKKIVDLGWKLDEGGKTSTS